MKRIISLLIILLVALTGCNKKDPNKEKLLGQYALLENVNHVFREVNVDEAINFMENKSGTIIFSFPTCPYCQAVMPLLNEAAKEEKIKEILYLDIYTIRKDNTEDYQKLLALITAQVEDLVFSDDTQTTRRIVVPDVYVVKDGKILKHHIATVKDQEGKWVKELTNTQASELKEIYRTMLVESK